MSLAEECFRAWHQYINGEISYPEFQKRLEEIRLKQPNLFTEENGNEDKKCLGKRRGDRPIHSGV